MTTEIDYKEFRAMLNSHSPDEQFTEEEAIEAYHNLTEFFMVLVRINEREKIVLTEGEIAQNATDT